MSKIIGIIGARSRNTIKDYLKIRKSFINHYDEGDWICSGGAEEGGDRIAYRLHKEFSTPYLEFPANWNKYGKGAGFIRNGDIAKHSDILIACVSPERTGGTEDTIRKFLKLKDKNNLFLVE